MTFLAVWTFLKGIFKAIPIWAWVAAGLLLAAFLYGESRYRSGQAERQGLWDAATTAAAQEAREKEAGWEAGIRDYAYSERLRSLKREQDLQSTIAGLRTGTVSVRPRFRCSVPKAPGAGSGHDAGPSGPEQSGGLQPADAEFLVRESDRADTVASRLLQCQHYVRIVSGS